MTYTFNSSSTLGELQRATRAVNEANGWFDRERPLSADIALLHSEVSEAYEAVRKDDMLNFREELGDILIRLLDTAERADVCLGSEVGRKLNINATRPYRHGGKVE